MKLKITSEELLTMTRAEYETALTGAYLKGAGIGLNEALQYSADNDIRRLRELKDEMRTAQLQLERSHVTTH